MGNLSSKKKTTPAQNINMTDASQVDQTALLQQMMQSMQGMSNAIQELNKTVKRLDDNDKQKAETAKTASRIATANNITNPNQKADLKKMIEENNKEVVAPLKEDNRISSEIFEDQYIQFKNRNNLNWWN